MGKRINQNQKGKRVERLACALLRSLGYEAQRSQQYCGNSPDSADVRHSVPGVRLEVKGGYGKEDVAGKTPADWLSKLKTETTEGIVPVVLWKRDRKNWLAVFEIEGLVVLTADIAAALNRGRVA